MKSAFVFASILSLILFVVISCGIAKAPAPVPPPSDSITKPLQPGTSPWDQTIAAAKKEGKVVVLTTGGKELGLAWSKGFKDKFGIEAEMVSGTGNEVSQKVLSERKAGLYLADVYAGGTTTSLTSFKPAGAIEAMDGVLMLPDVLNSDTWVRKKVEWADKDHTVFVFSMYARNPIAINTTLVRKGELKSLLDLLDPKYKGKISMNDPTIQGGGFSLFQVYLKAMGVDYWRQLAKQEILLSRDRRQIMDWLAKGKVNVTVAPNNESFSQFKEAGAPLEFLTPQEGTYLSTGNGSASLFRNAPHPNAAKLFINWILTQEGQTLFSKNMGVPSARADVATGHLPPEMLWKADEKYIAEDFSEEAMSDKTASMKVAQEVFAPYMGR